MARCSNLYDGLQSAIHNCNHLNDDMNFFCQSRIKNNDFMYISFLDGF